MMRQKGMCAAAAKRLTVSFVTFVPVYLCEIFQSSMFYPACELLPPPPDKHGSHWDPSIWALCHWSPFLIAKPVGDSGQLKLSICEHSKMLSSMNIYPEAPGEIPQHCPGLSLCLFPSRVPALHLQLCLPTQKLPAYTTSQVTALSGFQAPALPRVHLASQTPNSSHWGGSQRSPAAQFTWPYFDSLISACKTAVGIKAFLKSINIYTMLYMLETVLWGWCQT